MSRRVHQIARICAFVASAAVAIWLLARATPFATGPVRPIAIRVPAASREASSAEPLFAEPQSDAVPVTGSGPPRLIGIVGRLPEPLAMLRLDDGAIRTIGRGGAVSGWTLESLAADRATFRRGAEVRVSVLPPRDAAQ